MLTLDRTSLSMLAAIVGASLSGCAVVPLGSGMPSELSTTTALTTGTLPVAPTPRPGECQRLAAEIGEELQLAQGLPAQAKAQRDTPPSSLKSLFSWMSEEPGKGVQAVKDFEAKKLEIVNLEAKSRARGCPPVAIEAPLAEIEKAVNGG